MPFIRNQKFPSVKRTEIPYSQEYYKFYSLINFAPPLYHTLDIFSGKKVYLLDLHIFGVVGVAPFGFCQFTLYDSVSARKYEIVMEELVKQSTKLLIHFENPIFFENGIYAYSSGAWNGNILFNLSGKLLA